MSRYVAFLIVIIIVVTGFIITNMINGISGALIFGPFIILTFLVTYRVWLPDGYGKTKVRLASLALAATFFVPLPIWQDILLAFWPYFQKTLPFLNDYHPKPQYNSALSSVLAIISIFIVNYFMRDKTLTGKQEKPFSKEFPEDDYKKDLAIVSKTLSKIVTEIDLETYWSSAYYVPLEAEVETKDGNKKNISTLIENIRSDKKSKTFLVLGDPGAGKSVALRKLALEMHEEISSTERLALYINLKEWHVKSLWTETNRPKHEELRDFILKYHERDYHMSDFFKKYFDNMVKHGRIFFLFDSFDEIPQVLDEEESSWLINDLSNLFNHFIGGAHESRGLISSRQFRSPTKAFDPEKTLEIRPFTDDRIAKTLSNISHLNEHQIHDFFQKKQNWVSVARNPFNASLIATFFKEQGMVIPESQSHLFEIYLDSRLNSDGCKAQLKKAGLTKDGLIDFCVEVAWQMRGDPKGLEASKIELTESMGFEVQKYFEVLRYAKIARIALDQDTVSFVHRRFTEYFMSKYFVKFPEKLYLESIPTDSSGRDALVMYCETAPESSAKSVAEFCWKIVSESNPEELDITSVTYRHSILSLRFIAQSFRSRRDCLKGFYEELVDWISSAIKVETPLIVKHSLESIGLLEEKESEAAVIFALKRNDQWLSDSAIRACRHLGNVSADLQMNIMKYIDNMPSDEFERRKKELIFSFSLSDAFQQTRRFIIFKRWHNLISKVGIFLSLLIAPYVFLILLILCMFFVGIFIREDNSSNVDLDEYSEMSGLWYFAVCWINFLSLRILNQKLMPLPHFAILVIVIGMLFDYGEFSILNSIDIEFKYFLPYLTIFRHPSYSPKSSLHFLLKKNLA